MTVGIFEIETASTTTPVDFAVRVAEGPAAVRDSFRFYSIENCIELGIANMKRIVLTAAGLWIKAGAAPCFRFVSEQQREAFVDLYLCEMAVAGNGQSKDVRKEICRSDLIFRG